MFSKRPSKYSPPIRTNKDSPFLEKNSRTKLTVSVIVVCLIVIYLLCTKNRRRNDSDIEKLLNSDNLNVILEQDDPDLVLFVKQNYIFKKSAADRSIGEQSETRPSKLVEYLLGQNLVTKDVSDSRYFVEIGANDGLRFTSAFYLETNLGWSGLIVEPYSVPFKELMTRPTHSQNRISFSNTTIAMTPYASKEKFHYNPTVPFWGGLSFRFYKGTQKHMNVVTIPLYTLLLAADSPSKIDLLILDTEGTELETLKTLPFDKVEVSLIAVETYNGKEGPSAVEEFLFGKGYESVAKIEVPLDPKLVEQISSIIVRTDVHSEYQIFKLKQN